MCDAVFELLEILAVFLGEEKLRNSRTPGSDGFFLDAADGHHQPGQRQLPRHGQISYGGLLLG